MQVSCLLSLLLSGRELNMSNENDNAVAALHPLAIDRANRDPLPGALMDTFGDGPVEVAGFTVRKFVAGDYIVLKMLNSPIYQLILGDKDAEFSEESLIELCYILTRPAGEARKLAHDPATFRATAMSLVADKVSIQQLTDLNAAVMSRLTTHNSTVLTHSAGEAKVGERFLTVTAESPKTE